MLKHDRTIGFDAVASRAGAWIETQIGAKVEVYVLVASRAGAWIETFWHA